MHIEDARGRPIAEATVTLTKEEVTDLLIAASQIDDGTAGHAILRDPTGTTLAVYQATEEPTPLARQIDWWVGPLILFVIVLVVVGAFTIARAVVDLLF